MAKKKTKQPEMIQTVIITLNDGRKLYFSGAFQILPNDMALVAAVTFTDPKPMPEGYHFEKI